MKAQPSHARALARVEHVGRASNTGNTHRWEARVAPIVEESAESLVSVALLLPFLRVTGDGPMSLPGLSSEGLAPSDLAVPGCSVRYSIFVRWIETMARRHGSDKLGLEAGVRIALGDLGCIDRAICCCDTLREAIACVGRLASLLHTGLASQLVEHDGYAEWKLETTSAQRAVPAIDDFILASAFRFMEYQTGRSGWLREVHFCHPHATDAAAYARTFRGARLALAMPYNALLFRSDLLDAPMRAAHPVLQRVFELEARSLQHARGPVGRLRLALRRGLPRGQVSFQAIASDLRTGGASLRRRLRTEGTTYTRELNSVRRELAAHYLRDPALATSQVSDLLGFAHSSAFCKSFRRWFGVSPTTYRKDRADV